MNPLTQVKRIQKLNSVEASLGISEGASWHNKYKDSAYIFIGGIPFDLTEGDLLAVFAQYGEIMDLNLVRDKGTGKSKGFAFLAYEDQRSTILAVDNLNGAKVLGRIIRVDHVSNYKKKEEEDEEERKKKREARGICRAFQKGECNRGDSCKFSHDEQRAADTPGAREGNAKWGAREGNAKWGHEMFEPVKNNGRRDPPTQALERDRESKSLPTEKRDRVEDLGGRNNSSRVEDDDYRRSRRELDGHERGTTSKESGERRGRSRNQTADVDREA